MPETISDSGEEVPIATPAEVQKMLRSSDDNTRNYLTRHLENTTANPLGSTEFVAQQVPLVDNIVYDNSGVIETEKNNFLINLSYEPLSADSPEELLTAAFSEDKSDPESNIHNWRMVDKFSLTNKQTEKQLELTEKLPPETTIIFRIVPPARYCFKPDLNVCVFSENPTKPGVILLLLHEIGHSWAIKKLSLEERENYIQSLNDLDDGIIVSNENWAKFIEQERDAWAFALKTIRPFLGNNQGEGFITRDEARKIANEHALQRYSNVFRNELTRNPKFEELIAAIDQEVDE